MVDVQGPGGATICAFMRWDAWPLTSQDLDFALVDQGELAAVSENDQAGGPLPPVESVCATNARPVEREYWAVVVGYSVSRPVRFDLVVVGARRIEVNDSPGGSIVDPAASSPSAMAAGSQCVHGSFAPLSSQGLTIDGRSKPEISGPEGVSSATYGPAGASCQFDQLVGSSVAAAHVSGAAALRAQQVRASRPKSCRRGFRTTPLAT